MSSRRGRAKQMFGKQGEREHAACNRRSFWEMKQRPSHEQRLSQSRSWTDDTVVPGMRGGIRSRSIGRIGATGKRITATVNYELFLLTLECLSRESNEERLYNSCGKGT